VQRQVVGSGGRWEAAIGYSRVVRVGPFVYVSGTTAALPEGGVVGEADAGAQAREALRRIVKALEQVGADVSDVVRTRAYLTDVAAGEPVGRAHAEVFGAVRPASAMLVVTGMLDPALLVEIEADAVVAER